MRADRLISILMLLQARGQMTAQTLATELEVSERTIYRDVDALGMAGVPLYCEAGPGGGIGLLESYRTTLTGLTDGEVRALFAVSVPDALAATGIDDELRSALRKLAAALPPTRHTDDALHTEVHVDVAGWEHGEESVPHLHLLHQAVRQRRIVKMRCRRFHGVAIESTVAPLGLVVKAGAWQLVHLRADRTWVQPVRDILDVALTAANFTRPAGFDLRRFWQEWCAAVATQRALYNVTVRVAPPMQASLPQHFGAAVHQRMAQAPRDAAGWITLELGFDSLETARAVMLALGGGVEVLAPEALRRSVLDYAEQIVGVYAQHGNQSAGA